LKGQVSSQRRYESSKGCAHSASFFRTEKDQFGVAVPFILEGLDLGEKCLYLLDDHSPGEIVEALAKQKDVQQAVDDGQVVFLSKDETYLKGGAFEPDRMLKTIVQARDEALAGGYCGFRATGEMSWRCSDAPGAGRLMEYETKVNLLYPDLGSSLLCQYDESRFDQSDLMDALHTHPRVVIRGESCSNPYFMPPHEFLSLKEGEMPREVYERASLDVLKRARLSMIHRLEMRDFRRTRERLSLLETLVLNDIESLVQVVSFYNDLAKGTCKDAPTLAYLEEIARNCATIQDCLARARPRGEAEWTRRR
jgi:hypothetical protein